MTSTKKKLLNSQCDGLSTASQPGSDLSELSSLTYWNQQPPGIYLWYTSENGCEMHIKHHMQLMG